MSNGPVQPRPPARPAPCAAASRDWPEYFRAVAGKAARETLLLALDAFGREGLAGPDRFAVDLGCGEGRDAAERVRRGWRVLAIDSHPMALDLLRSRRDVPDWSRVETRLAAFEGLALPPARLVNASFSLPFCLPGHADALWTRIVGALPPGGRFAGQLFGERDDWAGLPDRWHLTRAQVERRLEPFHVEMLTEEENDARDAQEHPKHWHVFHIVARKR
jgi:tellurite methyltransferase